MWLAAAARPCLLSLTPISLKRARGQGLLRRSSGPGSRQSSKRKGLVGRKRNRAGRLFCVMARSKHVALGGFYRRMAGRKGGLAANVALARKLAVLFWRVMVKGVSYVEQGLAQYEAQVLETKRRALQRLAKQLGRVVLPSLAELQNA